LAKTLQLDPIRIGEKLRISGSVDWSLSGSRLCGYAPVRWQSFGCNYL